MARIDAFLKLGAAQGCSDVHLAVGVPPMLRMNGELMPIKFRNLAEAELESYVTEILTPSHRDTFMQGHDVDFSYVSGDNARFRVNVFRKDTGVGAVFRAIPSEVPTIESLNLPAVVSKFCDYHQGMVLVTGSTGTGKSTTLAAMIDLLNRNRRLNIISLEDPIEFVHRNKMATVTQREIRTDTLSYATGLRSALRQDPDVIMIGEMRDAETIETALVAAETGHLVFSTLHTLNAPETINRIVTVFPPHQQDQIRHQLAGVLRASVSQRLLQAADGKRRVLAAEVLVSTPYIKDCIQDRDKTSLIPDAIVAGASEYGMQSFDQAILKLCHDGVVSVAEAEGSVTNVEEFRMRLRGITTGAGTNMVTNGMGADEPRFVR